ncbi:Neuraminidase [Penicillium griseofulvum]|uniref:Neuraminidase n=1 Tax=Penicillium patulum TaxID=5078 RepID=A0A135L9L4_PENPA|nr:Neuraminidase [Penicillium griseofulvum]KXG45687.1 Neuraminidase [Penicillium griseofulvum]
MAVPIEEIPRLQTPIIQFHSTHNGATWNEPTFISHGHIKSSTALQYGFSNLDYIYDREARKVSNFHVFSNDQGVFGGILGTDNPIATLLALKSRSQPTWDLPMPIGKGMDKNKIVELSKVARTYGTSRFKTQLPDHANNSAIIRAYPDAAQGFVKAKVLLLTNANKKSVRVNGTILLL